MLTSHSLMTCDGYPTHVPITVCENLMPFHSTPSRQFALSQPANTSPYSIHVSSKNYTRDGMITVTVNGTKGIKVIKLDVCMLDFVKIAY